MNSNSEHIECSSYFIHNLSHLEGIFLSNLDLFSEVRNIKGVILLREGVRR